MSNNDADTSNGKSKLDVLLESGGFKTTMKQAKPKAVTISSNGVLTFNTQLKGAVYKAGGESRSVSISVNKDTQEILILVGDKDPALSEVNANVGATNGAVSAINLLKQLAEENGEWVLPNGIKTSSHRYEDKTGGLEVLRQDDDLLAVLLKKKDRQRNAKVIVESVTASGDVT